MRCHDTPGFIANRIGIFWMQCAVVEAFERGLSVEEADALMSHPIGVPKTGVFGLIDLVGLDLMPRVDESLAAHLAEGDPYHGIRRELPLVRKLIETGYTGRKGKGGFYRLNTQGGKRVKEAIDLKTGDYHPAAKPVLASLDASKAGGLRALVAHADKGGAYAWAVLSKTLSYAASLVPEIADDIHAVDRAMRLGYNWRDGPFALIDRLGAGYFAARLVEEGAAVPPLLAEAAQAGGFYRRDQAHNQYLTTGGAYAEMVRDEGVFLLADVKCTSEPLARNASASLWDVGDGVACLEVHTKMNSIDAGVLAMMQKALAIVAKGHRALVIYNEAEHFSAGVNLGLALFAANIAAWPMIEGLLAQGQQTFKALKHAPFPVVGAPSGLALGGGCEILLHCDAVVAHAESYIGLVEAGVGWCRAGAAARSCWRASPATPSGPAGRCRRLPPPSRPSAWPRSPSRRSRRGSWASSGPTDGITFNRERLLADAKARALELADGYKPPQPVALALPGPSGRAALGLALGELRRKGAATAHDMVVAGALAEVLTGGDGADHTEPMGDDAVLDLERAAIMRLVRTEPTLARMEHTLATGKPLRN